MELTVEHAAGAPLGARLSGGEKISKRLTLGGGPTLKL
jgi:hypothetical protein